MAVNPNSSPEDQATGPGFISEQQISSYGLAKVVQLRDRQKTKEDQQVISNDSEVDVLELLESEEVHQIVEDAKDVGTVDITELTATLDALGLESEQVVAIISYLSDNGVVIEGHLEGHKGPKLDSSKIALLEETKSTDSMTLFLIEVGKYELLTAAQEVELSKRKDVYLKYKLTEEEGKDKSPDEQERLFLEKIVHLPEDEQQAVKQGKIAFETLINSNLRLVISIAKRYQGHGLSLMDLTQEGTLGLNRAIEKFDWRKGYKISTYATWWIKQACQRAVANQGGIIRIPVYVIEHRLKLARAAKSFEAELHRQPSREELAEETGLSRDKVDIALDAAEVRASLNARVGDDSDVEFGDFLADQESADLFDETEDSMRRQMIRSSMELLPERERRVLEMRFGFGGKPSQTLESIGEALGITRERVRQIETTAIDKLYENPDLQSVVSIPSRKGDKVPDKVNNKPEKKEEYILTTGKPIKLSETDIKIFEQYEKGDTNKEVSETLGISEFTVKGRANVVLKDLGLTGTQRRIDAVRVLKGMVKAETEAEEA